MAARPVPEGEGTESTPPPGGLLPALEISVFRQGLLVLGAGSALTLMLPGLAAPMVPGNLTILATVSAACGFVLIAGSIGLLRASRPLRADRARLLAGEIWARWSYPTGPPGLRTPGTAQERSGRAFLAGALIVVAGTTALLVLGRYRSPAQDLVQGGALALLALLGLAQHRGTRSGPRRHRGTGGDLLLGPRGVYRVPGGYDPLFLPGFPEQVTLDEGATGLALRFLRIVDGPGTRRLAVLAVIPVPPGRESEARGLLVRYHEQVFRDST
ncbi:MAG: hypothetical protein P8Z68_00910 [Kineosporiaceae bacterium]